MKNLGRVRIEDMVDESFNAENVEITVVDPNTISFPNAGDEQVSTVETTGLLTPLLVPINEAVEKNLASGGLLRGAANKGGLAILLMTHRGVPRDPVVTTFQATQIRVSLFCKPVLNATGLKKPPLDVHAAILARMAVWSRGSGNELPEFAGWDSRENSEGDLAWFSDFNVLQMF